jgi:protein-L-isoaspartate(D-aspartate) O-methyltransferase
MQCRDGVETNPRIVYNACMKACVSIFLVLCFTLLCCVKSEGEKQIEPSAEGNTVDDYYKSARLHMVDAQMRKRGLSDNRVLKALETVPRHRFVPGDQVSNAYADHPLSIGYGQTISQPYIVALMTECLGLEPGDRVLEVGTGSGYQAAVLAELVEKVYSIEIVEPLGLSARDRLIELGYSNVEVRIGDGYLGWPEAAPFDAIIVTAAPETIPQPLIDQLADGASMVVPVGLHYQELILLTKKKGKVHQRSIANVRFVPMVSEPGKGNGGE